MEEDAYSPENSNRNKKAACSNKRNRCDMLLGAFFFVSKNVPKSFISSVVLSFFLNTNNDKCKSFVNLCCHIVTVKFQFAKMSHWGGAHVLATKIAACTGTYRFHKRPKLPRWRQKLLVCARLKLSFYVTRIIFLLKGQKGIPKTVLARKDIISLSFSSYSHSFAQKKEILILLLLHASMSSHFKTKHEILRSILSNNLRFIWLEIVNGLYKRYLKNGSIAY